MTRHINWLAIGVKASHSWTQNPGTSKGGESSNHVNWPVTGKVQNTNPEQKAIRVEVRGPSRGRPYPMSNYWVDKAHKNQFVGKISPKSAALSDCTRHNGGSSSSKGKLEEPEGIIVGVYGVCQEKVSVSDELLSGSESTWWY